MFSADRRCGARSCCTPAQPQCSRYYILLKTSYFLNPRVVQVSLTSICSRERLPSPDEGRFQRTKHTADLNTNALSKYLNAVELPSSWNCFRCPLSTKVGGAIGEHMRIRKNPLGAAGAPQVHFPSEKPWQSYNILRAAAGIGS